MTTKSDASLDCVGLYCPMPIVETAKRIADLAPGEVLEVVADDPGIEYDMPAWCESTGHEYLGLERRGDDFYVYVRKKEEA